MVCAVFNSYLVVFGLQFYFFRFHCAVALGAQANVRTQMLLNAHLRLYIILQEFIYTHVHFAVCMADMHAAEPNRRRKATERKKKRINK